MPANLLKCFMAFLLAFVGMPLALFAGTAYADTAEDETAPLITSVAIAEGSTFAPGGTVTVLLGFEEEGTGVVDATASVAWDPDFMQGTSSAAGSAYGSVSDADSPLYSGVIAVDVVLPDNARSGSWHVTSVGLTDQRGNSTGAYIEWNTDVEDSFRLVGGVGQASLPAPGFAVANPAEGYDYDAPVIDAVRILDSDAAKQPGQTVTVAIDFTEEGSGVTSIGCSLEREEENGIGGPSYGGTMADAWCDLPEPMQSGTALIDVQLPADAKQGDWIVYSISLTDKNGNGSSLMRVYYEDQDVYMLSDQGSPSYEIANPGFTVASGSGVADFDLPEILDVRVVGDGQVNRPGIAKIEVTFKDEGSGVARVSASAAPLAYCDGYGNLAQSYGTADCPEPVVGEGSAVIELPIASKDRVGEWRVTSVCVEDAAGNASQIDIYGHGDEQVYSYFEIQGQEVLAPRFTVQDEFEFSFEMALSNPKLLQAVQGIRDGYAARILIDGDGVLSRDILEAIAGRDVTLVCYKDAYQWVINGKQIVSDPKDLDLDVDIFQEPGDPYGIDEDVVRLVFYPNGALPGPIQLRFKSDYLYAYAGIEGELHLYYIDGGEYIEEDGDIDLVFDGTDKWCYATFTHNSEFLVSPAELSSAAAGAGHGQSVKPLGTGADGDAALADTGDAAGAAAGACLAGAAVEACGIAFAASRRKRSE